MVKTSFYRAFEDRFRGSRELIKSRLKVYLPFIIPLKQYYPDSHGVDLGCGRGEWLELMREHGVTVQGFDLDHGMLDATRELGLNVINGEAIKSLQSLAAESQMLVTGFHLAEHLPFEALQILIQESLRVLRPGGLLILETPNAENIIVGTEKFYLDPTHQRPIPLQLLSFMAEYYGFNRVKVIRLQESPEIINDNTLALLNVLYDVSPDYAIVAQKAGDPIVDSATTMAFDVDYGVSLESLLNRYYIQQRSQTETLNQASTQLNIVEEKLQRAESLLDMIFNSYAWRLTAPLRLIHKLFINIFRKQS
jgi:O-antigen chain-terminating methyltransferase